MDNYPYRNAVRRHLDVPIYNDGKIVVVAGVCNNREKLRQFRYPPGDHAS